MYKKYDDKVVLDDIDLAVAEGEFVTVVGPSGCGMKNSIGMKKTGMIL